MNINEDTFTSWANPPSESEADRCDNAENAVRKAIAADESLSMLKLSVFAQGSVRARTNVRQNSDVDICVRRNDVFFDLYPTGKSRADFKNVASPVLFPEFKNQVETAMVQYFGADGLSRGDKAICIHANTYRIDADVVPTFEYRWYTGDVKDDGSDYFHSGVSFRTDSGKLIFNWPEQNYINGVSRNNSSARRYKRVIRILKRMRDRMIVDDVPEAQSMASFLIECLVWNAPPSAFAHARYTDNIRDVLAHTWNQTRTDNECANWGEVNELKYLFHPGQPWTRQSAHDFLQAAWDYSGFE